jgi:RNA polymerase sigma factor (TIGR02999 family)
MSLRCRPGARQRVLWEFLPSGVSGGKKPKSYALTRWHPKAFFKDFSVSIMSEDRPAPDAIPADAASAAAELMPQVYTELRRLAAAKMARERPGHTLQATALVHEAYLRLANAPCQQFWNNRIHFFAAAAEAMRRILIENARRKQRAKRGGRPEAVAFDEVEIAAPTPDEKLIMIDDCLDELERESPVEAQVVKLHYYAGLTLEEIAQVTGVAEITVRRRHAFAKAWIYEHLQQTDRPPE